MRMGSLALWGLSGLAVAAVGGYIISLFNSIVQVRNNIDKAWQNIDVILQQRYDELPKLVETCTAYAKHERATLEKLTRLRVGYTGAKTTDDKVRIENEVSRQLAQVRAVSEGYPDLKASQNYMHVQKRISALESTISDRREFFNDSVNIFNIQIEQFPQSVLAQALRYRRHPFLEVPEHKKQDVALKFA
jgi:LemA protein